MTVVPEGATVVDIGLVQVYAWHERTVGTKISLRTILCSVRRGMCTT